jgi:hypothetical protein
MSYFKIEKFQYLERYSKGEFDEIKKAGPWSCLRALGV